MYNGVDDVKDTLYGEQQQIRQSIQQITKMKRNIRAKKYTSKKRNKEHNIRKTTLMPGESVKDILEIERERRTSFIIDDIPKAGTFPDREKYPAWLLLSHGTIIITDKETKEPVFVVRFTPLDKLRQDTQKFDKLQRVFHFHINSISLLYPIKVNGAHKRAGGGGVIVGHGYRKGYDKGYLFGKYHPNNRIQQNFKNG